jgi:tetratricopeptide (TPR) repeat protein
MKIFSAAIHFALLITTPTLFAYPTCEPQQFHTQSIQVPDLRTLSYDEVIDLLALIESDSFDERYSPYDLEQINQFLALLAMEGSTESEKPEMYCAVASLTADTPLYYALYNRADTSYANVPAIYYPASKEIVLCKSWCKKQFQQTQLFVKKHKKAIIIGAIVVVTVAVVVVAAVAISTAATTAAIAAAAAASANNSFSEPNASLTTSIQNQVSTFKETIAQEQFAAIADLNEITLEENGRIVGSLFAHKTIEGIKNDFANNPAYGHELKGLGFDSQYPTPNWLQTNVGSNTIMPHASTDLAFSTDYANTYAGDLNLISYETRGNLAYNYECYGQAIQDYGNAITIDPSNPTLYLERGIANFELGNYEQSMSDYQQYVEKKAEPFSVTDFSIGFARGVPRGAYESGEGAILFLSEFITHPIHTSKQVVDALTQLATLAKNDEFGLIAEALSPELHQLVTDWDTLPSYTRGELSGYALGKIGTDLLAPGAVAKIASKSITTGRELATICKNFHLAKETLILETANGIGIPAKVSEIISMGKKSATLGEELGFTAQEIGELQKTKTLEQVVNKAHYDLPPHLQESNILYQKAQGVLGKHKGFMPESEVRNLIHQTGIKTLPRPKGIPEDYRIKLSKTGGGMKYVHPNNEQNYIRVMPGKPHSPYPYQQKPYVNVMKDGKTIDNFGNVVLNTSEEAHIPYDQYIYRS